MAPMARRRDTLMTRYPFFSILLKGTPAGSSAFRMTCEGSAATRGFQTAQLNGWLFAQGLGII